MLATRLKKDSYFDSVMLMALSRRLREIPGIEDAAVAMATPANLEWLGGAGLLPPGRQLQANPSDLLVAVRGEEPAVARALQEVDSALAGRTAAAGQPRVAGGMSYRSVSLAARQTEGANVALISVPGPYARLQAEESLRAGLHVMLFSDNVPREDEVALKRLAAERGLLMMGPDCGTAILAGRGLGFANRVARGPIGLVGASGTGLQQVSCLLDGLGVGVSHALGAGSHDLSEEVGGLTFKAALRALGADPPTGVLVLLSKPPSPGVAAEVLREAGATGKPAVACFLGAEPGTEPAGPVRVVATLEEAALAAAALALGARPGWPLEEDRAALAAVERAIARGPRPAGFLRGLFCGGTLCTEAQLVLAASLGRVLSNASFRPDLAWSPGDERAAHLLIDLGDDFFTIGRPHPMIDGSERLRQVEAVLSEGSTALLLLDVILGHGAEEDPAGRLAEALQRGARAGRSVPVVVSFCAAAGDPQGFQAQRRKLEEAGAHVFRSNAAAARAAAALLLADPAILGTGGH